MPSINKVRNTAREIRYWLREAGFKCFGVTNGVGYTTYVKKDKYFDLLTDDKQGRRFSIIEQPTFKAEKGLYTFHFKMVCDGGFIKTKVFHEEQFLFYSSSYYFRGIPDLLIHYMKTGEVLQ